MWNSKTRFSRILITWCSSIRCCAHVRDRVLERERMARAIELAYWNENTLFVEHHREPSFGNDVQRHVNCAWLVKHRALAADDGLTGESLAPKDADKLALQDFCDAVE